MKRAKKANLKIEMYCVVRRWGRRSWTSATLPKSPSKFVCSTGLLGNTWQKWQGNDYVFTFDNAVDSRQFQYHRLEWRNLVENVWTQVQGILWCTHNLIIHVNKLWRKKLIKPQNFDGFSSSFYNKWTPPVSARRRVTFRPNSPKDTSRSNPSLWDEGTAHS